jgi:ABC-2 type transport system ATP-binding protein
MVDRAVHSTDSDEDGDRSADAEAAGAPADAVARDASSAHSVGSEQSQSAHSAGSEQSPQPSSERQSPQTPAVRIQNLTKSYGDITAVDDVSLSIEPGTAVGVLGPNGAGKTTLLKAALGLVLPTDGEVEVAGVDVHDAPRQAYGHVGATLEGARNIYWRLTVQENLDFFSRLAGVAPDRAHDRQQRLLEGFDLTDRADTTVNDLSRGMKQKVALASTLSRDVDVAFLDEPTLGLDIESSIELRRELRRLVERESMTVVISSHDMDTIEAVCDRVVVLNQGQVIADDAVENLLDVFRTQSYEVTISESPTPSLQRDLESTYDADNWTDLGDRVRFEVALSGGEGLHALTGALLDADAQVLGVDAVEPDLEEVFLRLTGDEGSAGRVPQSEDTGSASTDGDRS